MKYLLKISLLLLLLGTDFVSFAQRKPTFVTREFRLVKRTGNVFAPAAKQQVRLKFTNKPQLTLTAYTNSQGVLKFKSYRCRDTDYDGELIFNSTSTKSALRIPIGLGCGTEDAYPEGYIYGIYSMDDGKHIPDDVFAKDFTCPKCKKIR
jgi:hypothetical protein